MYKFALAAIYAYLPRLPAAMAMTLWISLLAILGSFAIGLAGALARTARPRVLRALGTAYVEVLRNTPLLIIIYLAYFGLAQIGLRLSGFQSALLALALNGGAY